MDFRRAEVWEVAMVVAAETCRIASRLPREERFGMRSQVTRASISVPSNIVEGWRRESAKEKLQFFAIAHGSLAELQTQLMLCQRLGWAPGAEIDDLLNLTEQVSRMLTVLKQRWRRSTTPRR
ncbi:four helix bundle protein [Arenimonas sp.]|uniref:four helix bundle protein n=1 Tax=Arenimonas sp. TaxID=1872635 RepID=UPI0039E457A7